MAKQGTENLSKKVPISQAPNIIDTDSSYFFCRRPIFTPGRKICIPQGENICFSAEYTPLVLPLLPPNAPCFCIQQPKSPLKPKTACGYSPILRSFAYMRIFLYIFASILQHHLAFLSFWQQFFIFSYKFCNFAIAKFQLVLYNAYIIKLGSAQDKEETL